VFSVNVFRIARVAALLPALAVTVRGEVVRVFTEDDARILNINNSPGYQNANYRNDILSVYTVGSNVQRTLIRFDLAAVAPGPGQRLSSAVLHLTASTGFGRNPGGSRMEVWRVTRPWVESETTWLHASTGVLWTSPGGDMAGGHSGPFAVSTANPPNDSVVSWDVTELVDLWLEGLLPNHGLLMLSTPGNGLTFRQSEAPPIGNAVLAPHLIVETVPGVPRLQAELDPVTGDAVLSWRDVGTAVLQERPTVDSQEGWTDSSLSVEVLAGRSVVRTPRAAEARFYRLRPLSGTP